MRIYTRTVSSWQPDGSLKIEKSESFDYEGPISLCKDSPSPPPAPDYTGAAKQTQLSQMSSQYTPYGSQIYSADPNSPSGYQSNITLAPQAQQALNSQLGLSAGMGNLATSMLPGVQQQYSAPMSFGSVPQIADKAYSTMTARLDPQWAQAGEMQASQLANQGIVPGTEAYNNAMRTFNQAKNDAYQQANLGAIETMPQTYQLAQAAYNQPLNQLNAIRSGAQIQTPQFGTTPGANLSGAAQAAGQYAGNVYNQQIAQQNAQTSGLFGLGGALGGAYLLGNGVPPWMQAAGTMIGF